MRPDGFEHTLDMDVIDSDTNRDYCPNSNCDENVWAVEISAKVYNQLRRDVKKTKGYGVPFYFSKEELDNGMPRVDDLEVYNKRMFEQSLKRLPE